MTTLAELRKVAPVDTMGMYDGQMFTDNYADLRAATVKANDETAGLQLDQQRAEGMILQDGEYTIVMDRCKCGQTCVEGACYCHMCGRRTTPFVLVNLTENL